MIWYYFILFITNVLTAAFSWLPQVTALPTVLGIDIDTQLSQGMGMFYTFAEVVWPVKDVFYGMLALLAYYGIKTIALRFLLGARAPQ